MDIPTPPPPHARPLSESDADRRIDEALRNPTTRKRIKQAGQRACQKVREEVRESLRNTPPEGTAA